MIAAHQFFKKRVALFGLGGSGLVTAQSLLAGGAELWAWDDNPDQVEKAKRAEIPVGNLRDLDWHGLDALVLAPGVPLTHPKPHWSAQLAAAHNVPIIGDIEIFVRERAARARDCPLIAITGTNGKSTTTALIDHILRSAGKKVQMGGNIGTAILSLAPPDNEQTQNFEQIYVVECSSYQIDLAPSLNPSAGILLNLSPDHLDRHGTMDHYASIKERLVAKSENAIIGVDDEWCRSIAQRLSESAPNTVPISVEQTLIRGVFLDNDTVIYQKSESDRLEFSLSDIETLRGRHNAQNAAAAIAACLTVGLNPDDIQTALRQFGGLKHRMQPVARYKNILFVNDSKATNAEAAAPALKSFEHIFWIAGGLAKENGIRSLLPLLGQVQKVFLIGDAAPSFAAELGHNVEYEIAQTIDRAVAQAHKAALNLSSEHKATILFSPACASFDQFRNFEVRGAAFVNEVSAIKDVDMLVSQGTKDKNHD